MKLLLGLIFVVGGDCNGVGVGEMVWFFPEPLGNKCVALNVLQNSESNGGSSMVTMLCIGKLKSSSSLS